MKAQKRPHIIGVIHLPPLPGSPRYSGNMQKIIDFALRDARALETGGVDAICIENFGDMPFYAQQIPAETVAAMAVIATHIQQNTKLAFGFNCLRNDANAALALAAAVGGEFIRVNVHMGAAITDQGIIQGRAFATMRKRQQIAPKVKLFADVHVKHAQALDPDIQHSAQELVHRGLADVLVVTGYATGVQPMQEDLQKVRQAIGSRVPVFAGSGVNPDNVVDLFPLVNGFIVGTYLKQGGKIENPVDVKRVRKLVQTINQIKT